MFLSSQRTSSPASLFESSGITFDEGEDSRNTIATSIIEPDESPRGVMLHNTRQSQIDTPTRTPEQIRQVSPYSQSLHSYSEHGSVLVPNRLQDARAIKLRLSLASYKLRTNQLDVPLERLQVKTMSSNLPPLPRLPRLPGTHGTTICKRKPLPSAPSAIPNIEVRDFSIASGLEDLDCH